MWHPRTKTFAICAMLVVLYNDWVFGLLLNPHLSARFSLISELSAQTQAYHWVFQALDIVAGSLTLLLLPWLWKFLRKLDFQYAALLFVTIASIGADNVADALLPISCAPSVDRQCSLLATHSILTEAHLVESTVIGIATFVAPLLWWWSCKAKHTLIAKTSLWFVVLQIIVGCGILASRAIDYNVTGAFQRAYELGIGLWVAGILYAALLATAKQRVPMPRLQLNTDKVPVPVVALSRDE